MALDLGPMALLRLATIARCVSRLTGILPINPASQIDEAAEVFRDVRRVARALDAIFRSILCIAISKRTMLRRI